MAAFDHGPVETTTPSRFTHASNHTVASTNGQTDLQYVNSEHSIRSFEDEEEPTYTMVPDLDFKSGAPPPSPMKS